MRRYQTLVAIMLVAIVAPTSIYALQNDLFKMTENAPEATALAYIRDAPTFRFLGDTTSPVATGSFTPV